MANYEIPPKYTVWDPISSLFLPQKNSIILIIESIDAKFLCGIISNIISGLSPTICSSIPVSKPVIPILLTVILIPWPSLFITLENDSNPALVAA